MKGDERKRDGSRPKLKGDGKERATDGPLSLLIFFSNTKVGNPIILGDASIIVGDKSNLSESVEPNPRSGSVGTGNGEREASPLRPATTPGPRDSATPYQDLDPAELASPATASVLGVPDENEPLVLIPNCHSDIIEAETQQWQNTGGEGNSRSGTSLPYKCDVVTPSLVTKGLIKTTRA